MSTARTGVEADRTWRAFYLVAAVSAALFVVLTLASIAAIAVTGLPSGGGSSTLPGGAATLQYIGSNRWAFIVDELLIQGPFLLTIFVFMALYVALRDVNRSWAAIGAATTIAYVVSTLSIFPVVFGLVYLSDLSQAAPTDAQHAALASSADALLAQFNTVSAAATLGNVGILILALVMVRGVFPRWVAYLGVATGAMGIVAEALRPILGAGFAVYGLCLLVWLSAVGWHLQRLSRDE
jgi:hypothetical protein